MLYYVPRNPNVKGNFGSAFQINMIGVRFVGSLLEQTGANIEKYNWSGVGAETGYVDAATCKDWARRIRAAVPNLKVIKIPDPAYAGGLT